MRANTAESVWSDPKKVELLRKLYDEGCSCSLIAAQIGGTVSRNAVIGKLHRLGLTRSDTPRKVETYVRKPRVQRTSSAHYEAKRITAKKFMPEWMAEPFVPAEDIQIPVEQRKSLLELNTETCRWPVGDPATEDFYFCGGQAFAGKPYCATHCRLAYQPPTARSKRNYAGAIDRFEAAQAKHETFGNGYVDAEAKAA